MYLGAGWGSLLAAARRGLIQNAGRDFTLPEVAQLLKVADKTVHTMAQKSELPAFKVRGQWRFKHDDIDA